MSGRKSYEAGKAAEHQVAQLYAAEGHTILCRRWRGQAGELDLVVEKDGEVVFVEVKQSRRAADAALHLTQRQIRRIYASAADFLGFMPAGQNTNTRFDVALVNGAGRIERVANAICG